jgi:hypothetical protein
MYKVQFSDCDFPWDTEEYGRLDHAMRAAKELRRDWMWVRVVKDRKVIWNQDAA